MKVILSIMVAGALIAQSALSDPTPASLVELTQLLAEAPRVDPFTMFDSTQEAMAAPCCKVCRKGKACGDTCISRDKVCHVPPGCACDG